MGNALFLSAVWTIDLRNWSNQLGLQQNLEIDHWSNLTTSTW
jgi:hypothetical protein